MKAIQKKENSQKADSEMNRPDVKTLTETEKYFKRLKFRLTAGVLVCFIVPHIILLAYFHFHMNSSLKATAKLNLEALAKSQRNTIDLFLEERVMNIRNLFYSMDASIKRCSKKSDINTNIKNDTTDEIKTDKKVWLKPSHETMVNYFQKLKQTSDAFVDLAFLNGKGVQTAYAGPFPKLLGKKYENQKWFKALMEKDRDYFITDIYLGFRKKPHFTIAVKQFIENKPYIMRSTIDPDKFYMFLRSISRGKQMQTSMINNKGQYQLVDPTMGNLFAKSTYMPSQDAQSGVSALKGCDDTGTVLIAHAWLHETPWALLISQPLKLVHAEMYRTSYIIIINFCILLIVLTLGIWFMINKLVNRYQKTAEHSQHLKTQLIHASKLASLGELATGIAHEINNPLAIITSTTGVVRDRFNPEFNMDAAPEDFFKDLDIIDSAVFRASGITKQLLDYGRKNEPENTLCNINKVLDNVLDGVKKYQFNVENIKLIKNYNPDLPDIMTDPNRLSQVFLNLINNAGDAISGKGTITISTDIKDDYIKISVQDTGKGMTSDQIKEIFNPFFTTKEPGRGTGLGLSISLSIIDTMKGTIEVQSLPGKGSIFIVSLPVGDSGNSGKKEAEE